MSADHFVDTNLLVYWRDASEPEKQRQAQAWMEWLIRNRRGALSIQVLQEYYVTVTRKLRPGLSREQARADVGDLHSWDPVTVDPSILSRAWQIEDRYSISWRDSLIAAAALSLDCRFLLTEDLQDGLRIDALTVLNPFECPPKPADA